MDREEETASMFHSQYKREQYFGDDRMISRRTKHRKTVPIEEKKERSQDSIEEESK